MVIFRIILISIFCFFCQLLIAVFTNGDVIYRYLPTNILYFIIPYLTFKKLDKEFKIKALIIFLIPALLILLVGIHAYIIQNTIKTIPLGISIVVSNLIAYFTFSNKKRLKIILTYAILLVFTFYLKLNYFNGISYKIKIENFSNDLEIKFENKDSFQIKNKRGKILVFDLWSSSCGVCFKKFPEFQKTANQYANDSLVEFYSLNLPLKRDTIEVSSLISDYNFKKLYAKNLKSWDLLGVKSVPRTLIIDKNGKITYNGTFNNNKYLFYNNVNRIIKKMKNE